MPKNAKGEEITQEQFDALPAEEKAEITKVAGAKPQIQASDIVGMKELMTETLSEFAANNAQQPVTQPEPDDGVVKPTEVDPLNQAITQSTDPRFAQQDIEIAAAADAALFYATHPDEVVNKDEIEQAFNNLKAQGKAFNREAIRDWRRGSQKNFDKAVSDGVAAEQKKIKDAEDGVTVDGSGRPVLDSPKVDHTSSEEDVNKNLENAEF